jgi:Flp pilus assembly pilin Flp
VRPVRRVDDGAVAVEFALLLPIVVLLVFGAIDFALAWRTSIQLKNAASNAALYAIGQPCDYTTIRDRALAELADLSDPSPPPSPSVDVLDATTGTSINPCTTFSGDVEVVVRRDHALLVPGVLWFIPSTLSISGSEVVRTA